MIVIGRRERACAARGGGVHGRSDHHPCLCRDDGPRPADLRRRRHRRRRQQHRRGGSHRGGARRPRCGARDRRRRHDRDSRAHRRAPPPQPVPLQRHRRRCRHLHPALQAALPLRGGADPRAGLSQRAGRVRRSDPVRHHLLQRPRRPARRRHGPGGGRCRHPRHHDALDPRPRPISKPARPSSSAGTAPPRGACAPGTACATSSMSATSCAGASRPWPTATASASTPTRRR